MRAKAPALSRGRLFQILLFLFLAAAYFFEMAALKAVAAPEAEIALPSESALPTVKSGAAPSIVQPLPSLSSSALPTKLPSAQQSPDVRTDDVSRSAAAAAVVVPVRRCSAAEAAAERDVTERLWGGDEFSSDTTGKADVDRGGGSYLASLRRGAAAVGAHSLLSTAGSARAQRRRE